MLFPMVCLKVCALPCYSIVDWLIEYEDMPQSLLTPVLFDGWLIDWVRGYASKSAHSRVIRWLIDWLSTRICLKVCALPCYSMVDWLIDWDAQTLRHVLVRCAIAMFYVKRIFLREKIHYHAWERERRDNHELSREERCSYWPQEWQPLVYYRIRPPRDRVLNYSKNAEEEREGRHSRAPITTWWFISLWTCFH